MLEVASGSGGPALYVAGTAGCRVTGIDANENGVATANAMAASSGDAHRLRFTLADATARLPFDASTSSSVPAGGLLSDPVVITGPVTNHELAVRSSIGLFLFVPPESTSGSSKRPAFSSCDRRTSPRMPRQSRAAGTSRQRHRDELIKIEREERFEGLQRFFAAVQRLMSERRLSRIVYLVEKRGG